MLRRMMIVLVLGCLCFGSVVVSSEDKPKIAALEWTAQMTTGSRNRHKMYVVPFINRLKGLGISTDCLSPAELFTEKKVYEYDAVVVIPYVLTQDEYDELESYVKEGGIFIPVHTGGIAIDIDEDGYLKWPPDVFVYGKGGILYELAGGLGAGANPKITGFEVLRSCPVTEGLKVGEKIKIEPELQGYSIVPDEDVEVCCGNVAVIGKKKDMGYSLIQVKRTGKGATIWITARINLSREQWADTLLKNIFSKKTFSWALGNDVI